MKRKAKRLNIFLIMLSLLLILFTINLSIVSRDEPQKSDALVILMGGDADRENAAIDFYTRNLADSIFMIKIVEDSSLLRNQNNILISRMPEFVSKSLTEKGIDSSRIRIVEGPSYNTLGEAKAMSRYCKNVPAIKSIMVVTSSPHTGRAGAMFKDVFGKYNPGVKVIVPFNSYSDYSVTEWYKNAEQRRATFMEMIKRLAYVAWFRWGI